MSPRALANQEREQQVQKMRRLGRSGVLLLATLLSFATLSLLVVDQLYRPDTFLIDQLKVKGKFRYLQPDQVESTVANISIGNFFSVELLEIKRQVELLPWVQNADVRREWPNTLVIEVIEHLPVMRWSDDAWINSFAEVITLPGTVLVDNPVTLKGDKRHAKLMLHTAVAWKRRLSAQGLTLKTVTLSDSLAWSLTMHDSVHDNDFALLLGREHMEQRLTRFEYLYAGEFQADNLKLNRVDARYPDGLAINASRVEFTPNQITDVVAMQSSDEVLRR